LIADVADRRPDRRPFYVFAGIRQYQRRGITLLFAQPEKPVGGIKESPDQQWPAVDLAVAAIESAKMDLAGKKPN